MSEDSRIERNDDKEQRNKRGIIVLVSLFVIVCLGTVCFCYVLFNLPSIYQFWLSNFTDEGKAGQALLEEANTWEVAFSDDFEEDKKVWWVGTDSDEWGIFEQTIEDGVYRIDATANKGLYYKEIPDIHSVRDFYLSVEVDKTSGCPTGDYGVVFRKNGPNFYNFTINDAGTFVVKIMYQEEWEQLKIGNYFPRGGEDTPRKITIIAEGANVFFFVDDKFVTYIDDEHFPYGFVGVTFGLHCAGDQAVFEFDNFELRVP